MTKQSFERRNENNLTLLLELAARKQNESADATCAVASFLSESEEKLEDDLFDSIFEKVTELAQISLEKTPNYRRASRELLAGVTQKTRRKGPGNK